jgi:HSP20 family protein
MADPHSDTTSVSSSERSRKGANQSIPSSSSRAEPASFRSGGKAGSGREADKNGGIDFTPEGGEMAEASRRAMLAATRFWEHALEPFQAFQASMARWSDQLWRDAAGGARSVQVSRLLTPAPLFGLPSTDVKETAEAYAVSVELPGMTEQDVSVSTDDDQLILRGQKIEEGSHATSTYRRSERWFGRFERIIPLPSDVAGDRIRSSMQNGVLEIVLPKKASALEPTQTAARH